MSNITDNVVIHGHALKCHHCEGHTFVESRAQLNTAGMTLLGLDFANKEAFTYACRTCGFVHWFDMQSIKLPTDDI